MFHPRKAEKRFEGCDTYESYESLSSSLEGLNKSQTGYQQIRFNKEASGHSGEQHQLNVTQGIKCQTEPSYLVHIRWFELCDTPAGQGRLTLLIQTAAFPALSNTVRPRLRQSCLRAQRKTRKYPAHCISTQRQEKLAWFMKNSPPSAPTAVLFPLISLILCL